MSHQLITSTYLCPYFFFFITTPPNQIYTLSLHDALPISARTSRCRARSRSRCRSQRPPRTSSSPARPRSEEHTSELQSRFDLVCRLLLEKKKQIGYEIRDCYLTDRIGDSSYIVVGVRISG